MRTWAYCASAGLCLALVVAAWGGKTAKIDPNTSTCGDSGTAIEFLDSPKEAAKQAAKEQKLVLILHVSGNFEDPRVT